MTDRYKIVSAVVHRVVCALRNIVSTVNLDCKLDLKAIALKARNSEYNPKACDRFAAVIMRIREPKTTALIFASGKMVCTGAKSEEQSRLAARKDFKIQNIVGSCEVSSLIAEGPRFQGGARIETYEAFENIYPVLTGFRKNQHWYEL
ncbi:unnamed protein product [Malus baccata var. baccata]